MPSVHDTSIRFHSLYDCTSRTRTSLLSHPPLLYPPPPLSTPALPALPALPLSQTYAYEALLRYVERANRSRHVPAVGKTLEEIEGVDFLRRSLRHTYQTDVRSNAM